MASAAKGGQFGVRIAFLPDGNHLFLAVGDRRRSTPAQDPNQPRVSRSALPELDSRLRPQRDGRVERRARHGQIVCGGDNSISTWCNLYNFE
jgi:glucose/arabinose dehydrogenase